MLDSSLLDFNSDSAVATASQTVQAQPDVGSFDVESQIASSTITVECLTRSRELISEC